MSSTSRENMNELESFAITKRWKPIHPDRIQVYTFGTPNGVKVPIALEELGLKYEKHHVPLNESGVLTQEFLSLNPNNKIPAIIDPEGPVGSPIGIFESGAILLYLADKAGRLAGQTETERYSVMQWLMFQIGSVGPMFGQFGYFHMAAGKEIEDPRPRDRYLEEMKRLLRVINGQLEGKSWLAGDYSIADIAIGPWLETIGRFYKAEKETGYVEFENVVRYVDRFKERPAVAKGWSVALAN